MSLRASRNRHRVAIAARLKQLRELRESQDVEEKALTEALTALVEAETPRPSQPGEYVLEYIPVHPASVEQGHCGICGESSIGWDPKWTGCPVCRNPIKVKHESLDGQNARTAHEDVRQAISEIGKKENVWQKAV